MQRKMCFLLAFMALLSLISSVAGETQIPSEGSFIGLNQNGDNITYTVKPMSWDLYVPGIIKQHNFTGTVQDVYAHVKKNYPKYDWPMPALYNDTTGSENGSFMSDSPADNSRRTSGKIVCHAFANAYSGFIDDGISYLYGVPGQPGSDAGPGTCGRVSCGYNAGIWWCNDNPYPITLSNYSMIADSAYDIARLNWMGGCTFRSGAWFTSGQVFQEGAWNVIAAGLAEGSC